MWILLALAVVGLIAFEVRTSSLGSYVFDKAARSMTFSLGRGGSPEFRHPQSGPYDIRLGHSQLSGYLTRLGRAEFEIQAQARASPALARLMDLGFYPVYPEKTQAGLTLVDRDGNALFSARWPERAYPNFKTIPPLIVRTLAYIENREILDPRHPYKNPAVEWDRLAHATASFWLSRMGVAEPAGGGSTLATQLEKIRHSKDGVTHSAGEKARQMVSASLRAYLGGRETLETRERVVCEYLNSVPLAAIRGYGEVNGLGDGLALWFGTDFDEVNRLLGRMESDVLEGRELASIGHAYRQALSLLLAIKKPTQYLTQDREALASRTNLYLEALCQRGIIPVWLRNEAMKSRLEFRDRLDPAAPVSFSNRKGVNAIRRELIELLGVNSLYELDRLDLSVATTLDGPAQAAVTSFLQQLQDPAFAEKAGLRQPRLLEQADPAGVIYSVSLYERGAGVNVLRVRADNYDQPLDISDGTKLELGSTAKLRTLVTYLEAIAALHQRLGALSLDDLKAFVPANEDVLTLWAREYLLTSTDKRLEAMLDAAMDRRYSASPGEAFFTGRGLHQFSNFEPEDNDRILGVREAFYRSVNLVFIRLMRDVVRHATYQLPGVSRAIFENSGHPARQKYLNRFADMESRQYLSKFSREFGDAKPDAALEQLARRIHMTPRRLTALYRSVFPTAGLDGLTAFLTANLNTASPPPATIAELYEDFAPGKFNLSDRAYLAGVHPLELWMLEYKGRNPGATSSEVLSASEAARRISYEWLFRSRQRQAQDRAIRIMLEAEAFEEIHKSWKRLGYPFGRLVPSYATAIGSSGDTPAALAELVGAILNDGVRNPMLRIRSMDFAEKTPFETVLAPRAVQGEQVLPAAIARIVRQELFGVVEKGTARRAYGSIVLRGGEAVPIGGKTGTGDNRLERYSRGGDVIESRVINRTATFVFLIGDRFFGVVTAFVAGEAASQYGFTSSLPVQVFKNLAPTLTPLVERGRTPPTPGS